MASGSFDITKLSVKKLMALAFHECNHDPQHAFIALVSAAASMFNQSIRKVSEEQFIVDCRSIYQQYTHQQEIERTVQHGSKVEKDPS